MDQVKTIVRNENGALENKLLRTTVWTCDL